MDESERDYLRRRMDQEIEMAARAACDLSASRHRELARLYGERLACRAGVGRALPLSICA